VVFRPLTDGENATFAERLRDVVLTVADCKRSPKCASGWRVKAYPPIPYRLPPGSGIDAGWYKRSEVGEPTP